MPIVLPTPASTPDYQAPELRAKATPQASGPEPAFSQALSRKRDDLGDTGIADPAPQPETTDLATDDVAAPGGAAGSAPDEPREAVPPTDAAAQGSSGDAQVLPANVPTGTRVAAPAAPADSQITGPSAPLPPTSIPTPTPTPTPTPPPSIEPVPDATPQPGAPDHAPAKPLGSPAPAGTASIPTPVVPQAVQTQAGPEPLPPVEPQVTPGPVRAGGEPQPRPQQQWTGTGTQSGNRDGQPPAHHPAVGRAMQVQAAVTVGNVTGQLPPPTLAGPQVAVAGAEPTAATAALPGEDTTNAGRLVRGLTAMLHQRGGSMTMRLDPPALGQLRVQMTIARGVVTAEFQPGTAEAQALLDRSIATLRSALESQGLTVERLTVHAPPGAHSARETAEDQSQQQQQQSTRHQSDAGEGRSRGRGDDQSRQGTPNDRAATSFAAALEGDFATENLPDRTGAEAA